ncbi:Lsr2 family protein [Micromonospora sp. WMMD1082]|uniref:histone-like nucleoid-structuring protein Lsr2 n=1 Tax=Micromonospora sp. WMMD1082 TaxID=3016104 RepID=UPI002416A3C3|nr:Lsr2 family protein [Micromonospora sp. WMMD1082]MDG4795049.1 Lsr2 family protein [Micromonospora sp. WMMD1082]
MATKTIVVISDDIDHSTDDVHTLRFVLDGVEYEIDLAPHNLATMRKNLAPYVAAGRRLGKHTAARPRVAPSRDHHPGTPPRQQPLPRRGHSRMVQAVRDPFAAGLPAADQGHR